MLQYFIPSKLFLLIVLVFSFQSNHYGQITTTIDFEIAGNGYTPSSTEGSGWTDVFNRTNHNMTIVSNEDGYYWACEDLLALSDPSIDLDQIDISGAISFTFAVDLLAKHIDDWDASDELLITYSVDGASYQNLMWVQSMAGSGFNTPAGLDLAFDGDGDCGAATTLPSRSSGTESASGCTVSSSNFATFSTNEISLSGNNTLDIKFQFNGLLSGDEGIYIDNITITSIGSSATTPSAPTIASIENGEGQVTVNFTAGADGGASISDFEYSIDGGSNFTSMGTTSSPYIITGLTNGTDYNIQIRAVNSEGAGSASVTSIGSPYLNEYSLSSFNSSVTETFNNLASSGTSTTLPTGIYLDESGSNANTSYSTSTGTSTGGNTYSFGSDSDRALGGVASGSLQTSFGAKIRNETGTTLNSVVISYTGESWRIGSANRLDQLDFQYSTDATSLDDGTWTDFNDLDYVNTGQATGSGSIQHTASLADTLTSLGVTNNGLLWIRWNDLNASGADDGMAVDDLSITAICKAGSIATSHENILIGNDITWTYTGTDFTCYEYHWGDNLWNTPFLTNETDSWGLNQGGSQAILYIRAKASCASEVSYSNIVSTFWTNCYTEPITATVDGSSILSGGEFTINSTVIWTWPTVGSGDGAGHKLGYYWDSDPADPSNYNWVWGGDDAMGGPQSWSDNAGSNFSSVDKLLYVKSRSTGISSCTNYSQPFVITLKKPTITVSQISGSLASCSGSASLNSEMFSISGDYISNNSGITVTAPTGFEVSTDDSNFSGSLILSTSSGAISNTTIYVRITASASGTPTGDIICTATQATNQNISLTGTISAPPSITSPSSSTSDAATCGENTYAIAMANSISGSWAQSPAAATLIETSQGAQNITVNPFTGLNTNITLTWTENTGACNGITAQKTIAFNQPTAVGSPDTDCYLWGGLTDIDWSTGSNWYKWNSNMWMSQTEAPSSSLAKVYLNDKTTGNICISAINTPTAINGTYASINIDSNSQIDFGSASLTINGGITNEGTILAGTTSTVTLTSSVNQTFSGAGSTSFNNLILNKSSGDLFLNSPITVAGTLTMSKGNIVNGTNVLTIGTSSSSPGAISHISGSVTGKLRRYFADGSSSSKFFPIGTASKIRDVTVAFPTTPGTDQYLIASYNAGYAQLSGANLYAGLPLTTADGQLIQNYDDEGYWEINPGSTATVGGNIYSSDINSTAYNVTIHMNGLTGADGVTSMDRDKVRLIKSAGPGHTSWEALTHGSIGGTDANNDYTVTASGSGFSFFGAGTEDGNALPVELVSFNANCNDGVVDLLWETASENNSEDFEVEYSRDGVIWNTIHTEPAAGFSTELISYSYTHMHALGGDNYYRLTQNDVDGASVTYDNLIINANCQSAATGYFSVFPNPSSDVFNVLIQNTDKENSGDFKIMDTKGNIVLTKSFILFKGINIQTIQHRLLPGIYYLMIDSLSHPNEVIKISIQ